MTKEVCLKAFANEADVCSKKSKLFTKEDRPSFAFSVEHGNTSVIIEVQMNSYFNSLDCAMWVYRNGSYLTQPQALTEEAYQFYRQQNNPSPLPEDRYPLPHIKSHSHLEVVAREMVALARVVAKEWVARAEA